MYSEKYGLKQITSVLNEEDVPAPYDDAYRKQAGRGWGPSTIRFILKNERYVGRFVWKKRTWVTDPATGARTYRMRGEDEWVTTEQPQLAIVTKDIWDASTPGSPSGGAPRVALAAPAAPATSSRAFSVAASAEQRCAS